MFIPTADKRPHPRGLRTYIIDFIKLFSRKFLRIFEIMITKIKEGKTIAQVDIRAPKIPAVLNPANVAIFMPIGPGVIEDTAIMLLKSSMLYQWYCSLI